MWMDAAHLGSVAGPQTGFPATDPIGLGEVR